MTAQHNLPGNDPDILRGVGKALHQAFDPPTLLIDAAADAAFQQSIMRLRGVPGTHRGEKK